MQEGRWRYGKNEGKPTGASVRGGTSAFHRGYASRRGQGRRTRAGQTREGTVGVGGTLGPVCASVIRLTKLALLDAMNSILTAGRSKAVTMEQLKQRYPAGQFHPVVITEVTRMHHGHFCVAGWDIHAGQMVRPLQPSGAHWELRNGQLPFRVGEVIHCHPAHREHGSPPHSHEDFLLLKIPGALKQFNEKETFDLLQRTVDTSVRKMFGQHLIDDKYIPDGAECRSLGAVCVQRRNVRFIKGYRPGKLRVELYDSDRILYDLPVTCEALLHAFSQEQPNSKSHSGHDAANQWLQVTRSDQPVMLRLGLARGWEGSDGTWNPKRCYLQLNGIICRDGNWRIIAGRPSGT